MNFSKAIHMAIFVLFGFTGLMRSSATAAEEKAGVFLSEIMYFPLENEPQWVEITNYGKEKTSIAGWCITDYDGNVYQFPKDFPMLPARAAVAVVFWEGDNPPPKDNLAFNPNETAVVHHNCGLGWQKKAFEAESDQCGLYSSAEMSEKTIRDYVCWGLIPNNDSLDPAKANLWEATKYLRIRVDAKNIPAGESAIGRGMTITRLRCTENRLTDWHWCSRPDVSMGKFNPNPRPYFSSTSGFAFLDYFHTAQWGSTEVYPEFCFQISDDPDFKTLLFDLTTNRCEHQFAQEDFTSGKYKDGKYYWRVKGIMQDKKETAWSVCEIKLMDSWFNMIKKREAEMKKKKKESPAEKKPAGEAAPPAPPEKPAEAPKKD